MSFLNNLTKPLLGRSDSAPTATAVLEPSTGEAQRYRLDTVGQVCPFPLVEAKQAIKDLAPGDELIIDFDCTQATDSIPHWAAAAGYPVTNFEQIGDATWTITVQKA